MQTEKHRRFGHFAARNRASIWLSFMIMLPAATMMHPTFASLIAIIVLGALVFTMRFVAHQEGRAMSAKFPSNGNM